MASRPKRPVSERRVRVTRGSSAKSLSARAKSDERDVGSIDAFLGLTAAKAEAALAVGLPFAALDLLQERLGIPREQVAALAAIPARTVARRRASGRFDPLESDRLIRLARVFAAASRLLDRDAEAARAWLAAPARAFAGRTPLDLCGTEVGAREVEALIGRLEHGVFG